MTEFVNPNEKSCSFLDDIELGDFQLPFNTNEKISNGEAESFILNYLLTENINKSFENTKRSSIYEPLFEWLTKGMVIKDENITKLVIDSKEVIIKEDSSLQQARNLISIIRKYDLKFLISYLYIIVKMLDGFQRTMQLNVWRASIDNIIYMLLIMKILIDVCGYEDDYASILFIYPKSSNAFNKSVYDYLSKEKSRSEINESILKISFPISQINITNNPFNSLLDYINYDYAFLYYYLIIINDDTEQKECATSGASEKEVILTPNEFSDENVAKIMEFILGTADAQKSRQLVKTVITGFTSSLSEIPMGSMRWIDEQQIPKIYLPAYRRIKEEIVSKQRYKQQRTEKYSEGKTFRMEMFTA